MNSKDKKNLIMAIVAVLTITLIAVGGTYAYWSWSSSSAQQTNVTVTVKGGSLTITGDNVTSTGMYPTNNCSGSAALIGSATVTAKNETATAMTATLKLRASLYAAQGTLNSTNQGKLKWAVVDTTSTTSKTCSSSPDYSGTLSSVTAATSASNFPNTTYTDISLTTFAVAANTTVTKKYSVYVWLDSSYTFTNTGTSVTDPMQNLSISVKWSPASTLAQS